MKHAIVSLFQKKRTCHEVDENVSTCTEPKVIDRLQCHVTKYHHPNKMCPLYDRTESQRKKTCQKVMTVCKCHHCHASFCTKLSNNAEALTYVRSDHTAADSLNTAVAQRLSQGIVKRCSVTLVHYTLALYPGENLTD